MLSLLPIAKMNIRKSITKESMPIIVNCISLDNNFMGCWWLLNMVLEAEAEVMDGIAPSKMTTFGLMRKEKLLRAAFRKWVKSFGIIRKTRISFSGEGVVTLTNIWIMKISLVNMINLSVCTSLKWCWFSMEAIQNQYSDRYSGWLFCFECKVKLMNLQKGNNWLSRKGDFTSFSSVKI